MSIAHRAQPFPNKDKADQGLRLVLAAAVVDAGVFDVDYTLAGMSELLLQLKG